MDRSFEQIFIESLVESLSKEAAGYGTGEEAPSELAARKSAEEWAKLSPKEKLLHYGKKAVALPGKAYGAAKGAVTPAAKKIQEAWQTSGRGGKAAMIGVPAAGLATAGLTGAALLHALKGKKKED